LQHNSIIEFAAELSMPTTHLEIMTGVIGGYFVTLLGIGFITQVRRAQPGDFFMAGRRNSGWQRPVLCSSHDERRRGPAYSGFAVAPCSSAGFI